MSEDPIKKLIQIIPTSQPLFAAYEYPTNRDGFSSLRLTPVHCLAIFEYSTEGYENKSSDRTQNIRPMIEIPGGGWVEANKLDETARYIATVTNMEEALAHFRNDGTVVAGKDPWFPWAK